MDKIGGNQHLDLSIKFHWLIHPNISLENNGEYLRDFCLGFEQQKPHGNLGKPCPTNMTIILENPFAISNFNHCHPSYT